MGHKAAYALSAALIALGGLLLLRALGLALMEPAVLDALLRRLLQ